MLTFDDCMIALARGQNTREKEVIDLFKKLTKPGSKRRNLMVDFINRTMECGSWNLCRTKIISKMDRMITEWAQECINAFPIIEARFQKCLENAIGSSERTASIRACQAKLEGELGHFKALLQSRIMRI